MLFYKGLYSKCICISTYFNVYFVSGKKVFLDYPKTTDFSAVAKVLNRFDFSLCCTKLHIAAIFAPLAQRRSSDQRARVKCALWHLFGHAGTIQNAFTFTAQKMCLGALAVSFILHKSFFFLLLQPVLSMGWIPKPWQTDDDIVCIISHEIIHHGIKKCACAEGCNRHVLGFL